jgi:hypothetical protein
MTMVANRVAAELYRLLFGIAAAVADIRVEQRLERERFVCEFDGPDRQLWLGEPVERFASLGEVLNPFRMGEGPVPR